MQLTWQPQTVDILKIPVDVRHVKSPQCVLQRGVYIHIYIAQGLNHLVDQDELRVGVQVIRPVPESPPCEMFHTYTARISI